MSTGMLMSGLKALVVLLLACAASNGHAQGSLLVSGKIEDQVTRQALEGASVTLIGRSISTIANADGVFTFYVPALYKNDTLHISVIGYEPYEAPLSEISFDRLLIGLRPSAISLQEVTITEFLTPEDILRLAIERIRLNYYSKPFIQNAFYREVQRANGQYVSLIEAALEIYNKDHSRRGQLVKVLQLRKSQGYKHLTNPFWNTYNVLLSSMELNTVGYISKRSLREYTLERQPNTTLDGKAVFILTTGTPELWPVKFYIQCDNFAFVRIEEMYEVTRDGVRSWKHANTDTVQVFPQTRNLTMDYKPSPEKYSLSTLQFSISMIYKGTRTNKEIFEFAIQQDLMVNDIQSVDVKPITRHEQLKWNLEEQVFTYDPDFWKNYNMIQRTPLHDRIRRDLERDSALEEQFQSQMAKPERPKK